MKAAEPSDWKNEALPVQRTTVRLNRAFSPAQMRKIRLGLIPEAMEDKWFVYWRDDTLFFHRSWKGICIYVVRFAAEGDSHRMIEAEVNRDPQQYQETRDERDAEIISYLIDVLLLQRDAVFPSDEPSPETRALMQWSLIGRAMLGHRHG